MKKVLGVAGLVFFSLSAQADYKMSLYDENGVETSQCVKSYSFSNNLESLEGLKRDIYSDSETLTNKIYFDKPVYRKVFSIPSTSSHQVTIDTGIDLSHIDAVVSIDDLVVDKTSGSLSFKYTSAYSQFWIDGATDNLFYYHNSGNGHNGIKATIEYTKQSDTVNSPAHVFRSYLHYVASSSATNEVETQDLDDVGVRFLKGYSYDSANDTCSK